MGIELDFKEAFLAALVGFMAMWALVVIKMEQQMNKRD